MKNKQKIPGFSYYKNIANFEALWRHKNFSKNLLFLGSELINISIGFGLTEKTSNSDFGSAEKPKHGNPNPIRIFG